MNRRLNYLLFNNSFIIFVFLGIIFKVDYISNYQILNNAFNILIMLTFILVCFLYLLHKKYDKLDYLIVTYLIIIGVSTIINNQDIVYYVFKKIPFLTIYFYTKLCLKYDERKFLKSFSTYFVLTTFINFISILYTSDRSINRVFFLGYDNSYTPYIVFGCFIQLLYYMRFHDNMSALEKGILKLSFVYNIVSCLIVRSATCKIGIILFLLSYILFKVLKIKDTKLLSYKMFYLLSIFIFFFIVIFRLQNYFDFIIVDLLNRDLTFTGRTYIWDKAISLIKDNMVLGLGFSDMELRIKAIGIYHAHSAYLNVLLESGIIGLIFYNSIFIECGSCIDKSKNKDIKNILSFLFFTLFILSINEVYVQLQIIYLVFALCTFYANYEDREMIK